MVPVPLNNAHAKLLMPLNADLQPGRGSWESRRSASVSFARPCFWSVLGSEEDENDGK